MSIRERGVKSDDKHGLTQHVGSAVPMNEALPVS